MARKKKEIEIPSKKRGRTKKTVKKEESSKVEVQDVTTENLDEVKETFLLDAKDVLFTEDDVKELEENKMENPYLTKSEEKTEDEVTETVVTEDNTKDKSDDVNELEETEKVDITAEQEENTDADNNEVGETTCEEVEKSESGEEPTTDDLFDAQEFLNSVNEEEEKKPKIKRRKTTTDVYGYHWMGLIYDE